MEVTANSAILVVAIVFVAFFGRQEYERYHPSAQPAPATLVGQTVTLPGVHFATQSRTLVLAISTVCHFCKDSELFYQKLASEDHKQTQIVAVLPQPLAEARSYVTKSIAPSIQVISSGLDTIGVRGTPTLLLLDGSGKVQKAWVGKLSDQGEKEVEALLM